MDTKTVQTSTELSFLITASKVVLSKKETQNLELILEQDSLDKKELIALAYRHAVLPLLYKTLKTLAPQHPLTGILKPYYMSIVQKNMAMSSQLISVSKLLETHDIPILSFKGAVLSELVYGDISHRQYGDLDVLIHKKDTLKMMTLLENEGYIPEIALQNASKKTFLKAVNVLGFHTPSKKTFIEVHWELLSKNYAITWDEKNLWKDITHIDINQHRLNTLSAEHTLLYLCTHGSKHLYERLSWVCDVDRLIRTQKSLDWTSIIFTSKKMGMHRMVLLSLSLCQTLLDLPLPQEIEDAIHKDKKVSILVDSIIALHFTNAKKETKNHSTFTLLWHMREKLSDKLRFTYLALFHPKFDDFKMIQLPNYLSFLYAVVRPTRLGMKYFK